MQSHDAPVPPLGVLDDWDEDRPTVSHLLPTGSLIVLSDGLFEAFDPRGEMFGLERTRDVLQDGRNCTPHEIMSALSEAVTTWQDKPDPADDQTVVVVSRTA